MIGLDLVVKKEDFIDVEVSEREFPKGDFIVKIHNDCFDEDMFESLFDGQSCEGWTQYMIGNSCEGAYVSDGQIFFVSPDGDIEITSETSVFRAEDVHVVKSKEKGEMVCLQMMI